MKKIVSALVAVVVALALSFASTGSAEAKKDTQWGGKHAVHKDTQWGGKISAKDTQWGG